MRLIRLLCLLSVLGLSTAYANVIDYTLTDLGGSEYMYEYFPSPDIQLEAGTDFLDSHFIAIYFPAVLYGALAAPTPPNPPHSLDAQFGVDPVAVDIFDAFMGSDGEYQIVAGINFPDLTAHTFQVTFTWFGPEGTQPGPQFFQIFDADLNLLDQGMTTPLDSANPVPEPPTIMLSAAVLGAIAFLRRRQGWGMQAA